MRSLKNSLKNRAITTACVAAVILAIAIVVPRRGEAQFASPVRVMNSLAQWVPNRDTDHPARNPFRKNFLLTIQNNDRAGDILNVPNGFRLVVETFSASVQVPVGEKVQLDFTSTVTSNGTAVASDTVVPAFFQGTFGGRLLFRQSAHANLRRPHRQHAQCRRAQDDGEWHGLCRYHDLGLPGSDSLIGPIC